MKMKTKRFICVILVIVMLTAIAVPLASANTQRGWVQQGSTWFYFDESGYMFSNGFARIDGTWYYFHQNGAMATGWIREIRDDSRTAWYYFHANGARASGTVIIDGTTYIFDTRNNEYWGNALVNEMEGIRNGWYQQNDIYYFYRNGVLQTGWQFIGGYWYFFDVGSGRMRTGWYPSVPTSDSPASTTTRYYLHSDGKMATGWQQMNNSWYYFQPSNGAMATGWLMLGTLWYYLDLTTGARFTGTHRIPAGSTNRFDFNQQGVWQGQAVEKWNGWYQEDGDWYYYINGKAAVGWERIDNRWYHFGNHPKNGQAGYMEMSKWIDTDPDYRYYVGEDGVMVTGWMFYKDDWYYFHPTVRPTGAMVKDDWVLTNRSWYYVDGEGKMVTGRFTTADGKVHLFSASGVWLGEATAGGGGSSSALLGGGWRLLEDGSWVFLVNSRIQTGWLLHRGAWYWLDPDNGGKMAEDHWLTWNGATYYLQSNGVMFTGWYYDSETEEWFWFQGSGARMEGNWLRWGGSWYWLQPNGGVMAANMTLVINGVSYTFRANGSMI